MDIVVYPIHNNVLQRYLFSGMMQGAYIVQQRISSMKSQEDYKSCTLTLPATKKPLTFPWYAAQCAGVQPRYVSHSQIRWNNSSLSARLVFIKTPRALLSPSRHAWCKAGSETTAKDPISCHLRWINHCIKQTHAQEIIFNVKDKHEQNRWIKKKSNYNEASRKSKAKWNEHTT